MRRSIAGPFAVVCPFICVLSANAETRVYFTQDIDRRFAWLGNDAHGNTDFIAHVVNLINSATVSIDASTMSFSSTEIGEALANRANAGVPVRIVMNGKHRYQPGVMEAIKGPVQIIDDNFPALVARVNFQQSGGSSPAGWLVDTGDVFGTHGAFSYGWSHDTTANMLVTPDTTYTSSLLGHCYARQNGMGTRTWEFALPNGHYYVHLVVGQPTFHPRNVIVVEGQGVFQDGEDFTDVFQTHEDFRSATVGGGGEARQVEVTDGRLTIQVGRTGESSYSTLCYVEIYRGDAEANGDEWEHVDRVQRFGLAHSKFLIIDGSRIWISSANFTGGASGRSEDAIETTDTDVITAFQVEFDQQWGTPGTVPAQTSSRFQRFKTMGGPTTASVPGVLTPGSFDWDVFFSPSRPTPFLDLAGRLRTLIEAADHELIFCLEQFTDAEPRYGFNTSEFVMDRLENCINAGMRVWGIFGNNLAGDRIFTLDDGNPNAFISRQASEEDGIGLHDKFLLIDALNDSRYTSRGKVLMGSMNWSQAGMVSNDEFTLLINDAAVANQFLQRAMKAMADEGLSYDRRAEIILILDRSASMNAPSANPLVSLMEASKLAADAFLTIVDPDAGNRVALVRFGSDVEPFTPVDSELTEFVSGSKAAHMAHINGTFATGSLSSSTCYGRALQRAHKQLEDASAPLRPRRIIHLFTDGLENTPPNADGVYQTLVSDFGAEIHSTAFGEFSPYPPGGTATILGTMAEASGGTFAQVEDLSPMNLQKRFIEVARSAVDLDAILDPELVVRPDKPTRTTVEIDSTVRLVEFVAYWGRRAPGFVKLVIKSPWGMVLDSTTPGVQEIEAEGSVAWHVDLAILGGTLARSPVGKYEISLIGSRQIDRRGESVGLAVLGDSDIDLQAEVVVDKIGSQRVKLLARLLDRGAPSVGTAITCHWTPSGFGRDRVRTRDFRLHDDGRHGDGAKGDGLYGAMVDLGGPGQHDFHLVATRKLHKATRLGISRVQRESTLQHVVHLSEPFDGPAPKEPNVVP